MIQQTTFDAIKQLSVAERILLAEKIWESISSEQGLVDVTMVQKEELDRRLVLYLTSPEEFKYREHVKERIKTCKL